MWGAEGLKPSDEVTLEQIEKDINEILKLVRPSEELEIWNKYIAKENSKNSELNEYKKWDIIKISKIENSNNSKKNKLIYFTVNWWQEEFKIWDTLFITYFCDEILIKKIEKFEKRLNDLIELKQDLKHKIMD